MILWNARTEKNCPPLFFDSDRKKLFIPLFLQCDTLIITNDTFTLCIELKYYIIVLGSPDSRTSLHLDT